MYVDPPSVVASTCISINGSIPGENALDVFVFSYLRSLFNNLRLHDPVKKLSVSLDLPLFILTDCTSEVTSLKTEAPPSLPVSKTPRTKSSSVNVSGVNPILTLNVGAAISLDLLP